MTFSLNDLDAIILSRANAGDGSSYTASLVNAGVDKCAQKLGEEAVETVIAAIGKDRDGLTKEAADVLYHLLVVLKVCDVPLESVMNELESRTSRTGLEEKASRRK
ncbi:MAG: phosphoribosyl-ATP diphosphatase [Rhizobiaceae bacterium]